MRLVGTTVSFVALLAGAGPDRAEDAGTRYAATYVLVGFRIRASAVCPGDPKAMVDHAFAPASSPEMRAFAKGFPETVKRWLSEGAGAFNTSVMRDGIDAACARARR